MSDLSPEAMESAREFLAAEAIDRSSAESMARSLEAASIRIQAGLSRWIGSQGYRSLLRRVMAMVAADHPALIRLRCLNDGDRDLADAIRTAGSAEVVRGFVAVVATLIHELGHVIGEEMAIGMLAQATKVGAADPVSESATRRA
jgi:hypothetical protein